MRVVAALIVLLLGLTFPLLLNGQTFTNSVLGIGLAVAAVALGLGPAQYPRAPKARRWTARVVVALGLLLAAALLAQLPAAYRFQSGFNRKVEELRRGTLPATRVKH